MEVDVVFGDLLSANGTRYQLYSDQLARLHSAPGSPHLCQLASSANRRCLAASDVLLA